jgi:hypothetical protein
MDPISFNMILIASKARMIKIAQMSNGPESSSVENLLIELRTLAGLE